MRRSHAQLSSRKYTRRSTSRSRARAARRSARKGQHGCIFLAAAVPSSDTILSLIGVRSVALGMLNRDDICRLCRLTDVVVDQVAKFRFNDLSDAFILHSAEIGECRNLP